MTTNNEAPLEICTTRDNGRVLEEFKTDINGVRQGEAITYFPDGSIYSSIQYKDGEAHGTCISYYSNGVISSIWEVYKAILTGPFSEYNEDGFTTCEGTYVDDQLEGPLIIRDDKGNIQKQYMYHQNCKNGECILYDADGKIIRHSFYASDINITDQVQKVVTDIRNLTNEDKTFIAVTYGIKCLPMELYDIDRVRK